MQKFTKIHKKKQQKNVQSFFQEYDEKIKSKVNKQNSIYESKAAAGGGEEDKSQLLV